MLKNYNNWHPGNYKGNLVSVENSLELHLNNHNIPNWQ